jgi:hypothetical protein
LAAPLQAIEWTEADQHAAEPPVHPTGGGGTAPVRH